MKKNHTYTSGSRCFYTAQVVDAYEGTSYDMTVIFEEDLSGEAPTLVDYYYGEPNILSTAYYVDRWLKKGN